MVCVSARERDISFPAALLVREPTEADVAKWNGGRDDLMVMRTEHRMRLSAGVNFLGAFTSQWRLREVPNHQSAPKSPPLPDTCAILYPVTDAAGVINSAPMFKFAESRALNPAAIHAGWLRVLKYLRDQEARAASDTGAAPLTLFTAPDGHDAPQVVLCRLSEVLTQRTTDGQHAHPHMFNSIQWAKNGAHLGALHDYAARNPSAWNIAEACRVRAAHCPSLVAAGQR